MKERTPIAVESEWTFDDIQSYYDEIERIATDKFGLDTYPNQIEIITSEQMLDAYAAAGMPINYSHWSFGKQFIRESEMYRRGYMGLAYEIVINSNPCIAYLMEENTMMMQILVMAHACFGHNAFFKNNYMFKQWTDADGIIDYLAFAKKYISECEEKYGFEEVESVLDACHALQSYGVDKYKRPPKLSAAQEEARRKEREEYLQYHVNQIWNTIPKKKKKKKKKKAENFPPEPQENVLYFIEKNAPNMDTWKRELVRIIRKLAQYFYPQRQTQVMNEGFATFIHYHIMQELHAEGLITDGFMLEFLSSHTSVIFQPDFDSPYFNGFNPYALGFAMFQDIKRICEEPTDEDREWFPSFAGDKDYMKTIKWAMENFKDESFIQQFLSPKLMRDFHLFALVDDELDQELEISAIHNDQGYRRVREMLSRQYSIINMIPDIQVYDVDVWGDRSITLRHYRVNNRPLENTEALEVLKHLRVLWGYDVELESVNADENKTEVVAEYKVTKDKTTLNVFVNEDDEDSN